MFIILAKDFRFKEEDYPNLIDEDNYVKVQRLKYQNFKVDKLNIEFEPKEYSFLPITEKRIFPYGDDKITVDTNFMIFKDRKLLNEKEFYEQYKIAINKNTDKLMTKEEYENMENMENMKKDKQKSKSGGNSI